MSNQTLAGVFLDERSVVSRSAQVDHERKVAIYDLIEENSFKLLGDFPGPFNLHLSIVENRFVFDIRDTDDNELSRFTQPLSPHLLLFFYGVAIPYQVVTHHKQQPSPNGLHLGVVLEGSQSHKL